MRLASTLRAATRFKSRTQLASEIVKRYRQKQEVATLQQPQQLTDPAEELESMMASAFIKENLNIFDSYQRKSDEIKNEKRKVEAEEQKNPEHQMFPYRVDVAPEIFTNKKTELTENLMPIEKQASMPPERGFFVVGDQFSDEYKAGTASELIEEEQLEMGYTIHGKIGSFEHIQMMAPGQSTEDTIFTNPKPKNEKIYEQEEDLEQDGEWKSSYGHADPNYQPKHAKSCTGCGAKFHCQDSALPGFVPVQLLKRIVRRDEHLNRSNIISELCRRCFMLRNYKFLLNVNVAPVDYRTLMGHLKLLQEVLILFVVDMTDIRGSIHRQLPKIIGDRKPMIVIGNKVDLLPPDAQTGYMQNFRDTLQKELEIARFTDLFNILNISLVSAKTGYGIEDLITAIFLRWMTPYGRLRGDMYVVGCTNAGKSTLFNTFIQSDLCKIRAIDLVDRVTTSVWPGTTLSLLKFPVMTPSPRRLELRRRRLLSHMAWAKKERAFQYKLFKETVNPKYLTLTGHVESTFKKFEDDSQPIGTENIESLFGGAQLKEEEKTNRSRISLNEPIFRMGNWCYDTPGTVDQEQIMDLFTLDELINVIPRSLIVPRTAVCQAGFSLLIGGIGRIDITNTYGGKEQVKVQNRPVYLTVFSSDRLPLHVLPTKEVDDYLAERLGTGLLGAPLGDEMRLAEFPKLKHQMFEIETANPMKLIGADDILLTSIGWVMVTSLHNVVLNAFTPAGRGLGRRAALLPHSINMKGRRIPSTRLYYPKVFLPGTRNRRPSLKTQESTTDQRLSSTFSVQSASYIQFTPWSGIQLSESLNETLENFASCLINDYVERWYKAEFSADNTFILETKYQIRFGGATAIRAIREFDFVHLLQTEAIPLVLMHVNRTSKYLDNLQLKETQVLNEHHVAKVFSKDLHVAMQSEQNQEEYLRRIADLLLKWPSETCRYFLRELVLSTILQPVLNFITAPDTINRLLITALEPSNRHAVDKSTEHKVGFLENFNKFCRADAPDSLLVLKLSDLSRDPRLLQSFDAYLRDIKGPSHWLDCFLQAHDVFNRLQKLRDNMCIEFNEVYSDVWQLYSAFIYGSARTRIELFSDELIESFKRAIDEKSLSDLIKSTERIYMDLYQELNYSYVVSFCQSENYLSHLCGKAPTIEELSQMDEEKEKSTNDQIAPPSSSLSQFPSRIWSMLRGEYEVEESTDEKNREILELDDEAKPLDAIDSSFLVLEDATPLDEININTWTIRIDKIEPRRRFRTGKIFYVYVVHVTQKEDESFDPVETACCSISSLSSGLTKKRVGSSCTTEIDVLTETTDHPLNMKDDNSDFDDEINFVPEEELEVFEALSQLPHSWSMARTYDEFYAFDSALRNFHGVNSQRFALLPDRKMMCARNRQFLESQRNYMEDFLRKLAKQPLLKSSELLFAFLTNPGEAGFETSFVEYDELTLRKSADRRKSAETEADQYITPFIARLLANTLASDEPQAKPSDDVMSLDSGMFPDNASEFNEEPNLFARVHPSNPHLNGAKNLIDFVREPSAKEVRALETFEKFRENVSILSVHVLGRCFKLPKLIQQMALTVASIFDRTLDRVFNRSLKFVTGLLFDESTLLAIVRALHLVVFEEHREDITAVDVERRAAQAERLLNHWLRPRVLDQISERTTEHVRLGIGHVFRCFQQVNFNRQLAFVLLDVLTAHLVPSNSQETE
ncbi:hypothetical protein M3Y98_00973200 [Aphelenchoides besseyi]|nr:hypothetical protein M3Y98_00973200 [Aphelenchoides besseyi]